MATTLELIGIAIFTGLGSGIGTPIGNWIFKKFLEGNIEKTHEKVTQVGKKLANGEIAVPNVDTEEQIRKILGK